MADFRGQTPLHSAVSGAHRKLDIIQLLIKNGAEITKAGLGGMTPLHSAASKCQICAVRLLLESGADPKQVADTRCIPPHLVTDWVKDWTPLHWAAKGGSKEVALLLMEHGADPNAVNHQGETPSQLAQGHGHFDVAQLIIGWCTDATD